MRLLFIRHGDPDYELDSLTEKGCEEAEALAAVIKYMNPGTIFVSPLGRAQKTASYSLDTLSVQAQTRSWLQEFPTRILVGDDPELQEAFPHARKEDGTYGETYTWDIMPSYSAAHPELFNPEKWRTSKIAVESNVLPVYDNIKKEFNSLLSSYGYVNQGHGLFRVEHETQETLTFFCHFGITTVLLSILWDCSPFQFLQQFCMLPSTVTELVTEERVPGEANFRALRIGDQSHLHIAGQQPSFQARFREVYSDTAHRC